MKPYLKWEASRHPSVDGRLPDVDYVNNCMMNIEPIDTGLADFIVIFLRKECSSDEFGIELRERIIKVEREIVVEVTVEKVYSNSAAKRANIECGDQIVQINSEMVTSKQCAEDLLSKVNKTAYINIIRLHEMFQKPSQNEKVIRTKFCYPFSPSIEKQRCKHPGKDCTNSNSTKICSLLIDQLKKRLLQKQRKTSTIETGKSKDDIRIGTNPTENIEDGLLMYTSPRHLAKTMRLQQEIFKRLIIAKKVGIMQDNDNSDLERKFSISSSNKEFSARNSSKWIIRKRADGTRYVTKRLMDNGNKSIEKDDSSKPSRKLFPCQLPINLDFSDDHIKSSEIGRCADNDQNVLSVIIL